MTKADVLRKLGWDQPLIDAYLTGRLPEDMPRLFLLHFSVPHLRPAIEGHLGDRLGPIKDWHRAYWEGAHDRSRLHPDWDRFFYQNMCERALTCSDWFHYIWSNAPPDRFMKQAAAALLANATSLEDWLFAWRAAEWDDQAGAAALAEEKITTLATTPADWQKVIDFLDSEDRDSESTLRNTALIALGRPGEVAEIVTYVPPSDSPAADNLLDVLRQTVQQLPADRPLDSYTALERFERELFTCLDRERPLEQREAAQLWIAHAELPFSIYYTTAVALLSGSESRLLMAMFHDELRLILIEKVAQSATTLKQCLQAWRFSSESPLRKKICNLCRSLDDWAAVWRVGHSDPELSRLALTNALEYAEPEPPQPM